MKKFNREFNGYNRNEVNALLNDVIIQTEKLVSKIEKQQLEIKSLKAEIVHYQDIERSLNLSLSNVQEMGESIRKNAQFEAKNILDDAYRNANRIVNDALIRNEKIEIKTQNAEKNLRILKNRLKKIVEQQLEVVEEIELLEIEE